jgi:glutathione peroxidase
LNYATVTKAATFPVLGKLDCENGNSTHPLYKFLKSKVVGSLGSRILWNFTKFVCDKDGVPIKRFAPNQSPKSIEKDLLQIISQ